MLLVVIFTILMTWANRSSFEWLTEEMQQLHKTEHVCLKRIYKRHFDEAYGTAEVLIKLLSGLTTFGVSSAIIFNTIVQLVVAEVDFPLAYYYDFLFIPVRGWSMWTVNTIYQATLGILIGQVLQSVGTFHIVYAFSLFGKFKAIIEIVRQMMSIKEELDGSFDEWVQIICDAMTSCRQLMSVYRDIYTLFLYVFEKLNYVVLFVSWVIFETQPIMIGTSFAGLSITLALFVIVVINERFFDLVSKHLP